MKIALAQTKPIKGDFEANLADHIRLVESAADAGADLVLFPELSLTGYEPALAAQLATGVGNSRFDPLQGLSDSHQVTIGVGHPLQTESGITIGMPLFCPGEPRTVYHKRYLHADEEPYFVPGPNFPILEIAQHNVALAICYELSVPAHAELACQHGAQIYVASVAKHAAGMAEAGQRLAALARSNRMPTLIVNCVGPSEDSAWVSSGGTAVWNQDGVMIGQLNSIDTGILMVDTAHEQTTISAHNL